MSRTQRQTRVRGSKQPTRKCTPHCDGHQQHLTAEELHGAPASAIVDNAEIAVKNEDKEEEIMMEEEEEEKGTEDPELRLLARS